MITITLASRITLLSSNPYLRIILSNSLLMSLSPFCNYILPQLPQLVKYKFHNSSKFFGGQARALGPGGDPRLGVGEGLFIGEGRHLVLDLILDAVDDEVRSFLELGVAGADPLDAVLFGDQLFEGVASVRSLAEGGGDRLEVVDGADVLDLETEATEQCHVRLGSLVADAVARSTACLVQLKDGADHIRGGIYSVYAVAVGDAHDIVMGAGDGGVAAKNGSCGGIHRFSPLTGACPPLILIYHFSGRFARTFSLILCIFFSTIFG